MVRCEACGVEITDGKKTCSGRCRVRPHRRRHLAATASSPPKWHGGKSYLAKRIVERMARHRHDVEPFAGGLAVLFRRDPDDRRLWWGQGGADRGVSELVNDLDSRLVNFRRLLRDQWPGSRELSRSRPGVVPAAPGHVSRPHQRPAGHAGRTRPGCPQTAESWMAGSESDDATASAAVVRQAVQGRAQQGHGGVGVAARTGQGGGVTQAGEGAGAQAPGEGGVEGGGP